MSILPIRKIQPVLLTAALLVLGTWQGAVPAATELADTPLSSATSAEVKPNILFVLDDSGSMNLKFMPDALQTRENRIGMRNHQCNLVYYNPAIRYVVPKTDAGGSVNSGTPSTFNAAYEEGFWNYDGRANTTVDLSTGFLAVTDDNLSYSTDENDATQAAYYWKYLGSQPLLPLAGDCEKTLTVANDGTTTGYCSNNTRVTVANPADASCGAGNTLLWKKIVVSSTTGPATTDINGDAAINAADADERQNFANWYSYYRNRLKMMKSSAGRAFVQLSDTYRIGFVTINPNNPVTASKFLTVAPFDSTQKPLWFTKLYSQTSNGSTPLRQALARAGRYYAGKTNDINSGMTGDPIQYSCQQNFTILTTDGYWNGSAGVTLDLGAVGNQDGVISELDAYRAVGSKYAVSPRPIYDGASQTYTWNAATKIHQYATCDVTRTQRKNVQWQYQDAQLQRRDQQIQRRDGELQRRNTQLQKRTARLQKSDNGGSSWTNVSTCTPSPTRLCRYNPSWSSWSSTSSCTDTSELEPTFSVEYATRCQTAVINDWAGTSSCSVDTTPADMRDCRNNWGGWYNASSCTTDFVPQYLRDCQTTDSGWYAVASCTPSVSNGLTVSCQQTGGGTWTDGACTPSATRICQTRDLTAWSDVASCTAVAQDGAGVATVCQTIVDSTGKKIQYQATTTATTYSGPNQAGSILSGPTPTVGSWTDLTGTCYVDATKPALPGDGAVTDAGPPTPPANCSSGSQVWPCETFSSGGGLTATINGGTWTLGEATLQTSVAHQFLVGHTVTIAGGNDADYRGTFEISSVPDNTHFTYVLLNDPGGNFVSVTNGTATLYAGSSDSLADVAQYYYKTDLRTSTLGNCTGALGGSTSVCDNNVPSSGSGNEDDRASWQHMTTFTMGLGLTGTVTYTPAYKTDQCQTATISAASWAPNVVTVTTSAAHSFFFNETITISGSTTTGYNGQYRITSIPSATTFTFAKTTTPGAFTGTATATGCPDFARIRSGSMNWPVPQSDSATALDDLWHAAVNGRGQYFSAADPETVVSSLTSTLAAISSRVASAAAAATSNLEPVAGDNFAYTAKYTTQKWTGELEAREINLASGQVSGTAIWSAQTKLDAKTRSACDNRVIKLFRSGATDNLVDFKWNSYACDASGVPTGSAVTSLNATEQANFSSTQIGLLSHYPNMGDGTGGTVNQRTPAAGANLVNFLRGQRGKEGFDSGPPITNTDINKLYRAREHILGDIVNAQPVFVRTPFGQYTDPGYSAFRTAQSGRTPTVYVAANDGMLHAFYAGNSIVDTQGGDEAWAFIPTMVLPDLYKLASEGYDTGHVYTVDGTPTAADIFDATASADCALPSPVTPAACWKTILVGGLNKGGKGYYALDVTNPAAPKALWEFKNSASCITVNATTKAPTTTAYTDCHVGYTFNNPVIGKLADGTWAVFVTSGYNNDDGIGYLYVLKAATGQILYRISTGVGTAVSPSGLNHINAWVDNGLFNNSITRVYGADLYGNVWRFDVNDTILPSGREATLVATVVDPNGTAQSITTKPELAEIAGQPFVYVATGRYLGVTDTANTQRQTIWAIKDPMTTTAVTDLRNTLGERIVSNVGSGLTSYRTVTATTCTTGEGWFADLPDTGERVNIDIKLQLGTLVAASNVPETNACNVGGYGWLNYFNYTTGCAVANSANASVGQRLVGSTGTESLAVGVNIVRLPDGRTVVIATTSAAEQITFDVPFDTPPPVGKRVSWREIVQ